MDPIKEAFIKQFSETKKPQSMKEATPFLMQFMQQAKQQNLQFSKSEIAVVAEMMCKDLSPEEKAKVNKVLTILKINEHS